MSDKCVFCEETTNIVLLNIQSEDKQKSADIYLCQHHFNLFKTTHCITSCENCFSIFIIERSRIINYPAEMLKPGNALFIFAGVCSYCDETLKETSSLINKSRPNLLSSN